MCHYAYLGYDRCCHEYISPHNYWIPCPFMPEGAPHRCMVASYTRHKIGIPFCDSCLDRTPPNHPPITDVINSFKNLRKGMEKAGVSKYICDRFTEDYKSNLLHVTERAATAGTNNNYYNEVNLLHRVYCRRANHEIDALEDDSDEYDAGVGR